ncbi:MAG: prepilin-type N-terminal cleavage/methylation domain-containing protein [Sedimentisphaerales bacterium]|nr:prepilin-type N-terminal cleavage/methylation domain-containing protein [Sedimentisphaerales bacterium]
MSVAIRVIRRASLRAFTLLELLVVVTLAALVMVLAAGPMAGRLKTVALRKSCGLVASAARQGRLLAMEGRQACRLVLDLDEQTVQLVILSTPANEHAETPPSGAAGARLNPFYRAQPLDKNVQIRRVCQGERFFQQGRVEMDFDRMGESEPVQIELGNGDMVRTLVMTPFGGKVIVFNGTLAAWQSSQQIGDTSVGGVGYE